MAVRIYACGGAACNLGSEFIQLNQSPNVAEVKTCFIDTSLSNLRDVPVKEENIFLLEDTDGSGKLRRSNSDKITESVKSIIHKFSPESLNIVLFSLSGGSGSVFSPLIIKELLQRGETVVSIVIGSEESKISIENTINTLKSLDTISRKHVNKPIVVSYWYNSKENSRKANDTGILQTITSLLVLTAKDNRELDTADISNFFNFDKVSSVKEGLSLLYITSKEEEAMKVEFPIAVASLFSNEEKSATALTPEYSCAGYPASNILKDTDLHFIIAQNELKSIYGKLTKRLSEFNETSGARQQAISLGGSEEANSDGLVL